MVVYLQVCHYHCHLLRMAFNFGSLLLAGSLLLYGALSNSGGSRQCLLCQGPTTSASLNAPNLLQPGKRPNFVFIMTDDQDLQMNSLDYQPAIRKHFSSQGVTYKNHFVTMSVCCPSRVSLWTGMAGHNTNVTDVSPPFGRLTSSFLWQI